MCAGHYDSLHTNSLLLVCCDRIREYAYAALRRHRRVEAHILLAALLWASRSREAAIGRLQVGRGGCCAARLSRVAAFCHLMPAPRVQSGLAEWPRSALLHSAAADAIGFGVGYLGRAGFMAYCASPPCQAALDANDAVGLGDNGNRARVALWHYRLAREHTHTDAEPSVVGVPMRMRLQLLRRLMWLEAATGNCEHALLVASDIQHHAPPAPAVPRGADKADRMLLRARARRSADGSTGGGGARACAAAEAALVSAACGGARRAGDSSAVEGNRTLVGLACSFEEFFSETEISAVLRGLMR